MARAANGFCRKLSRRSRSEGWNYSTDTGWKDWDIQVYGSFWWGIKLRTVTEYHGGPKCLTRIRLDTQMVATTFLINLVLLAILGYRQLFVPGNHLWLWIPYLIAVGFLAARGYRLKEARRRACRRGGTTLRICARRTKAGEKTI